MRISDWSSDVCSSDLPRLAWPVGDIGLLMIIIAVAHPQETSCEGEKSANRAIPCLNREDRSLGHIVLFALIWRRPFRNLQPPHDFDVASPQHQRSPAKLRDYRRAAISPRLPISKVRAVPASRSSPAYASRSEEHTSDLQSLMRLPYA